MELALVAERLALPGEADDLEGLHEAGLALPVGNAQDVVGAGRAAAPDPEVEPALAELIDGGGLLGDAERVAERQHLHRDPHAQSAGAAGQEAGQGEGSRLDRAVTVEVDLPEPDPVESTRLARVGQLDGLPQRGALADAAPPLLEEDAEVHGPRSLRARILRRGAALVKSAAVPVHPTARAQARPGISSRPTRNSMLEPAKSSPTGSKRPPRCAARNASATALKERRFSGRRKPWP